MHKSNIQDYFKIQKKRPRKSSPPNQSSKKKIATGTTLERVSTPTLPVPPSISSKCLDPPVRATIITPSASPERRVVPPPPQITPSTSTGNLSLTPGKLCKSPRSPTKSFSARAILKEPSILAVEEDNVFASPKKLVEFNAEELAKKQGSTAVKKLFGEPSGTTATAPSPAKVPPVPAYKRYAHLLQKEPPRSQLGSKLKPQEAPKLPLPSPVKTPLIPQSPLKDLAASPLKDPPKTDPIEDFPLPIKFKILAELFRASDMILHMKRRQERLNFKELRMSVHELFSRSTLTIANLHQMNVVFPGAFVLVKGARNEIEIENPKVESKNLLARRTQFYNNLLDITSKHHKDFLNSLSPPVIIPEGKRLVRWHPKFRVNEVPDINGAKPGLLKGESEDKTSHLNAKQIIDRATNLLKKNPEAFKKALRAPKREGEGLGNTVESEPGGDEPPKKKLDGSNSTSTIGAATKERNDKLKGLSQHLIDRIRARERETVVEKITMTKEEKDMQKMKNRLPTIMRILKNVFITEKKSAIALDLGLERLTHSLHNVLSYSEVNEHLQLLAKTLPQWLRILSLSSGRFLKIDRDLDINDLIAQINN